MATDSAGDPVTSLAVSDVLHKVYEKVDEKGAEAAAVTAVAVATSAIVETKCAIRAACRVLLAAFTKVYRCSLPRDDATSRREEFLALLFFRLLPSHAAGRR
jgi:hypothetical protein